MQRSLLTTLETWLHRTRRKPLILLGARQVGKTYLLKQFAQKHFSKTLFINFETNPKICSLFKNSLSPIHLIKMLEIHFNTTINIKNTLVVFDEIQECPEALNSLKYFCEEAPEYHIVAAGSLLGLEMKNTKGFPVGKVNFMHLYPLSYFEFLRALGEEKLADYLENITHIKPLEAVIHEKALSLFKQYLYVGGMPEAVKQYLDTGHLNTAREVHDSIIQAYEFDFSKHAPPHLINRITEVWHSMPSQLGKENKKFIFSIIRSGARAREYDAAIQWLIDARLVNRAINISVPRLPLPAYGESSTFKLYLNDVGLLGALSQLEGRVLTQDNTLFTEFKGALIENYVASVLAAKNDRRLYYWNSGNTAEVDFITQHEGKLYPLEVKSNSSSKKKSLLVYDQRYKPDMLGRASPMNLRHDGNLCNYPLYLMEKYPLI